MNIRLLIILLIPSLIYSQDRLSNLSQLRSDISKYGIDTIKCEENLSIYTEFYKQKSYDSAFESWLYLFIHAPKRTKNIYTQGAAMFKFFIKNELDSIKKEGLIDDLLTIYDYRNHYYPGQEGLVLGYKGSDLYKYRKSNLSSVEAAYNILENSFNIDKEKSSARALNYYFASGAKLTSKKILSKEQLIDLFSELSSVIEYKEAKISQENFNFNTQE